MVFNATGTEGTLIVGEAYKYSALSVKSLLYENYLLNASMLQKLYAKT